MYVVGDEQEMGRVRITTRRCLLFFAPVLVLSPVFLWADHHDSSPQTGPAVATSAEADPVVAARARAYYHYTMGHMYEEMAGVFRRSEYTQRAIDEYKQAIQYDPDSLLLTVELAEAYRRSGRIREAVRETQEVLERDPDNLPARRLLGRIYYQTLGDLEEQARSKRTLGLAIEQYQHIARLAPTETRSLLTLARLYRLNNELEKAEATLQQVLEVEPRSQQGRAALATLYSDQGDYQKAIALLEEAGQDSASSELLTSLARAYEKSNQHDKAVDAYRRALGEDQENRETRRQLAEALLRAERAEEALAEYKALVAADPEDAESLLRLSQVYRYLKRFEEAQQALDQSKQFASGNLEIFFNEALLHEARGEFREASRVLSNLLIQVTRPGDSYSEQEKRTRTVILERLGTLHRQTENFPAAVETFQMMLPLGPEEAQRAWAQIAETHRQGRDLEAALAAVRQALEHFPEERSFKLQLASLLGDHGELEQAVPSARALLTGGPEDRAVYLSLAQIFERNKKYADAEAAVDEAQKLSRAPGEQENVHFLRGAIYERQKKYEQAEEEFRRVLELNPDSAITLNYLGYMLADNGTKLEEAEKMIQRAVELDPYNGAYLDSLGWVYFRLEKLELAEDYLLRAVERVSRDPTIHQHLGDLYYRTGRLRRAEQAWTRALEGWERVPKTEFDSAVHAQVADKLRQLKVRLARETSQKPSPPPQP